MNGYLCSIWYIFEFLNEILKDFEEKEKNMVFKQ